MYNVYYIIRFFYIFEQLEGLAVERKKEAKQIPSKAMLTV